MNRENPIFRGLRFIKHWTKTGYGDARRRLREAEEEKRIRAERERAMTAEEEGPEQGIPGYTVLREPAVRLCPGAMEEVSKAIRETGAEMVYADEAYRYTIQNSEFIIHQSECGTENKEVKTVYQFKPDYGPDSLRGCNFIGPFMVCRTDLVKEAGAEHFAEMDEDGRWDATIRMAEAAKKVWHIPKVLYFRCGGGDPSQAQDDTGMSWMPEAGSIRCGGGDPSQAQDDTGAEYYLPRIRRVKDPIIGEPLVSILIPNKDHREDLRRCLDSIREKTTYRNYEIIIIENNSTEEETFRYYEELKKDGRIRVITREGAFNYSAVNNAGEREAKGGQILLLNNDTEVKSPDWIQEMLMFAQRQDVGAVGAKLYYPDGTIQHAGIGIGITIACGHLHRGFPGGSAGYFGRLQYAQNLSAVTGACMMIPRRVYEETHGLDESFPVVFNDVDLCLRIRQAGYLIVWTPRAELTHYESKSRGSDEDTPEKKKFFVRETNRFLRKWYRVLEDGDPYYNVNLTREKEDFSLR